MQQDLTYQVNQDLTINQIPATKTIIKAHLNSIQCVAGHPQQKCFATGSHDHTIKIWDFQTTKQLMHLVDHKQGVWSLQYSKDGKQLLSASPDAQIKIWDQNQGKVGITLKAHSDKVYDAKYSHGNKYIVSCGVGGEVFVWDVASLVKPIKKINIHQMFAYHVEWSLNDQLLFITTWQSKLYVFDGKTFQQLSCQTVTPRVDSKCQSCTTNFSLFPGRIYVATDRGNIAWYQYSQQKKILKKQRQFTGHMDQCRSVKLHDKKKQLVSTGRDGSVRLWDCSGEYVPKLLANLVFHTEKVTESIFMADWVITSSWDQNVAMWNLKI